MEETQKGNAEIPSTKVKTDPMAIIGKGLLLVILAAAIAIGIKYGQGLLTKDTKKGLFNIVVMDIDGIIEAKKNEFVAKHKDAKDLTKEQVQAMEKEAKDFSVALNNFIENESKDKVVLNKNIVVSQNVEDITEKAKKELNVTVVSDKKTP